MVAQARENLSRRVEAILVTAGLRPEKVQIQYDIKNPGEAKDFLEEVLNRLKNQIRKYNRITEKSRDFRSLLPFFTNHTAHPDLVRSYACFMRLLPRIQKTVQPNDMEDLLKEVHRCLKIGLQTRRLTSTQFFEICLGLGVYCDLQNEELSREIFDILSPRLKFLPFTLSIPYEVSLKDIIPALMFLLNVKHLHGEKISRAMQEVDIRDQQLMAVERRAFVKEVNWFARTLVSKLNFAEEQIEPRFQRELFICLRALGYTDKEIGRVMLGNNPAKDSGNGGREVVPGARGGALPQFVYPAGSQANRAGGGACAGP
jgi:hypothetical protein